MQTDFLLRPATQADMWDIYDLASSPEVRAVSIHANLISRAEHKKWYLAKLADQTCQLYVIRHQTKDFIGTVRFDLTGSLEFTITIYLVKEFRGRGLGHQIIRHASNALLGKYPQYKISAEIVEGNLGSLHSFLKAGYKQVSVKFLAGKSSLILEYNRKNMQQAILVVAAHPDDEILGCGGTLAKHVQAGDVVYGLILGEGKTSRDGHGKDELIALKKEAESSAKIIGIKQLFFADFPDNQFDSIPLLSIVKRIEEIKNKVKPNIVYTHHFGDMNIDHTLTHRAVMTATRPQPKEVVKSIYTFETPSSTEWNSYERNNIFVPNYFIDITSTLETKLKALAEYRSELRKYPHPRSLEYVQKLAELNGAKVGLSACESFALIRQLEDSA